MVMRHTRHTGRAARLAVGSSPVSRFELALQSGERWVYWHIGSVAWRVVWAVFQVMRAVAQWEPESVRREREAAEHRYERRVQEARWAAFERRQRAAQRVARAVQRLQERRA